MKHSVRAVAVVMVLALGTGVAAHAPRAVRAASNNTVYSQPTWWAKYQYLSSHGPRNAGSGTSLTVGPNVDVSNEATPQSETSIAIDPTNAAHLVAGSNEIVRDPMRAYASFNNGSTWLADDVPLPAPVSHNGFDFGSDPGVAFDSHGNVYYSYIVVFFSAGGLNGTEMAVAKSSNGGRSWGQVTYFDYENGKGVFDDKPYIAVDTNSGSPYRDRVYVTYDHTSNMNGKSSAHNAAVLAYSTNGGNTFSLPQPLDGFGGGPVSDIATMPFVGPAGQVYVAWQDIQNSRIDFVRSTNGGNTFSLPTTLHSTAVPYEVAVPAMAYRQALMYPSCGADRSSGVHRGRLYCAWMDQLSTGHTEIYLSHSDNGGASWSPRIRVNDGPPTADHFNHWLAVDPTDGSVDVSFYDTRNDPAGLKTDVYLARSTDGGQTFGPNVRVTNARSDETAPPADLGNQYGDYEGIAAFGDAIHPIWTDGRYDSTLGEEVFTATITAP